MSVTEDQKLAVRDLHVAYERDIDILRGVNLGVRMNKVTAVIGPNGAGKSTLLRAIAGLAPVVGGSVHLDGHDVTSSSPMRLLSMGLAFVPQEHTVFPQMTVLENLRMGGWPRRRDRRWLAERIEVCCDIFPVLRSKLRAPAGELSGGQQKLVEVVRALVSEPSVLLLDEPTAGLSPGMTKEVYEQIAALQAHAAVTILLVDQNIREALLLADYVYVLALGGNDTEGAADDIAGRLDAVVRGWMNRKGSGADV
ncbi:MAG: ABC transporter ATP-binding protein [Dehalococcoidales bacterium]|nr:ABC transporter ATP-binding protein [Dehalococcoidales bacterium]